MTTLKISKDISLPLEIVTQTIAIIAKRRAGKSYTMRKLVEQLLTTHQQVILVDPKGDQWGLRSSADGKKAGYPIVILGGEHGDAPLEASAGEVVAKLVVEERVSVLLDLSFFRKHEVATFMAAFLENLYRLKAREEYRTPVMLVIDEADAIAPQKPQKGEERMLGAADDIVRRGGQRGIGCALITQRSAVLNKNVLTQAQMLIVLRTIAPQDIAAMKAWIDVHGTLEQGKELIESLPSLPTGDAWFWSPGWPTAVGIFSRSHVLPIETFDSGATPKPGQKIIVPKNLADVDLDALKKQMAATLEKAKSDNPKELKKKIAELEGALKSREPDAPIAKVIEKRVEVPVLKDSQITRLEALFDKIVKESERHGNAMSLLWGTFNEVGSGIAAVIDSVKAGKESPQVIGKILPTRNIQTVAIPKEVIANDGEVRLSKGAKSILSYLHSVFPKSKTKTQLWVATGYSPGGGFGNLVSELTSASLIVSTGGGYMSTEMHYPSWIDDSFSADLNLWKAKLGLGARRVFEFMIQNPDMPYRKEQLAAATGYAMGGGFGNNISELTSAELIKRTPDGYIVNSQVLDL